MYAGEAKVIGVGREVVALLKDGSMCPIHLAETEVLVQITLIN